MMGTLVIFLGDTCRTTIYRDIFLRQIGGSAHFGMAWVVICCSQFGTVCIDWGGYKGVGGIEDHSSRISCTSLGHT